MEVFWRQGFEATSIDQLVAELGISRQSRVTTSRASLCKGKYGADDEGRLVEFDPSIGENGDWKAVTEVQDVSGGRCT